MPSSDPVKRIGDILSQIERIESYVKGMDYSSFDGDARTGDAVERCLERICEAARKIGTLLDAKYPEVDFPRLRALGSVLRHGYDDVNAKRIWETVETRLPLLKAACRKELGL